ncbi:hypothetical protein FA13DRAFT_701099 [Coprinellus micaceus]|uniref:Uncharacterized protein n=1 Tax=Coprinellus micaceus TaxID=71717 RepID=A0A4Y7S8A6_COPMI|nr:hypothetical protein FA13DRAFT_701099 [Coprinellus micaceus]
MLAFIAPDTRRGTLVLRMGNSALSFELSSFLAFWRLNTSESGYQIPLWPGKVSGCVGPTSMPSLALSSRSQAIRYEDLVMAYCVRLGCT